MRRYSFFVILALGACAHVPATVKASPGPVCQGLDFPADAPCLEAGEKAPFGGVLHTPENERARLAAFNAKAAENDSLQHSVVVDAGLVGGAVVLIVAAAVAGFEAGRALR